VDYIKFVQRQFAAGCGSLCHVYLETVQQSYLVAILIDLCRNDSRKEDRFKEQLDNFGFMLDKIDLFRQS
jgi:hypothetical protein